MHIRSVEQPARKSRGGLSGLQVALVGHLFDPLCGPHPEPRVSDQLRHGYRFEGAAVVFLESRPSFRDPTTWRDHDIAEFRFTKTTGQWSLYCQFRDRTWRAYAPLSTSKVLGELLTEMRRDPTAIFFG